MHLNIILKNYIILNYHIFRISLIIIIVKFISFKSDFRTFILNILEIKIIFKYTLVKRFYFFKNIGFIFNNKIFQFLLLLEFFKQWKILNFIKENRLFIIWKEIYLRNLVIIFLFFLLKNLLTNI
jgi:hypothetical protein